MVIIQRDLVELMASDPNTIVAILNRLQEQELIQRNPSEEDKRVYELSLTDKGVDRFKEAEPIALALQEEIVKGLSDREITALTHALERISANAIDLRTAESK